MRRVLRPGPPYVPTPPSSEATQRLSPDAAVASYAWNYDFQKFLGDASTGDNQWNDRGFPGTGSTAWVRFSFPTPPDTLTGQQIFRVRAKASSTSGAPKINVRVYENGTQRLALTAQNLTTSWATYSWTWQASVLSNASGADVELRLDLSDGTSGAGYASIDAVDWIARYTTSQPSTETWPSDWGSRPQLGFHHGIAQPFASAGLTQFNSWLGRAANVALVFGPPVQTWDDIAGGASGDDTTWSGQLAAPDVVRAFDPTAWPVTMPIVLAIATVAAASSNAWDENTGAWRNPGIWSAIVGGQYDLYFDRLFARIARKCAQTGRSPRTVVIVPAWEGNHRDVPHAIGSDVANFVAAWQRIVGRAHAAAEAILGSGNKFKIGLVASQHLEFGSGSVRLSQIYPGDAYVDHLGMIVRDYWGVANSSMWSAILTYPVTLQGATAEGIHDWLDFCAGRQGKWLGLALRANHVSTPSFPRTSDPEAWWGGVDALLRRYDGRITWMTHTWTTETRLDQSDGWGEPYRRRYGDMAVPELPTPLRTINVANASQLASALTNARPGDHIVLADGTYTGSFVLTVPGTAVNPIVVKAANKLGAVISGGFQIRADHQILWGLVFASGSGLQTWTGNFCKVLRCKFDGGIQSNDASTIELRGSDCEIARCEFANQRSRAITVNVQGGARRALVRYNWFHDVVDNGANFNAAVRIGQSSLEENTTASCIVEYNLFERYDARYGETVALKSCNNTVRFNTLIDCRISAIQSRVGHGNAINANVVKDQTGAAGGIRVMDRDNILLGNKLIGSGMRFEIFAGNRRPDERDADYSPPAYYPAAWNTVLAGNTGPVTVGAYYGSVSPPMTVNAKNTSIEAHTGAVTYSRHENTTVLPTTSRQIPQAVELRPTDVGPNSR